MIIIFYYVYGGLSLLSFIFNTHYSLSENQNGRRITSILTRICNFGAFVIATWLLIRISIDYGQDNCDTRMMNLALIYIVASSAALLSIVATAIIITYRLIKQIGIKHTIKRILHISSISQELPTHRDGLKLDFSVQENPAPPPPNNVHNEIRIQDSVPSPATASLNIA